MSYRNGATPELTRKSRQPWRLSSCEFSVLRNSTHTDFNNWSPRSSFSSRKSVSTESNYERKKRSFSSKDRQEKQEEGFIDDNSRRKSQSPSFSNRTWLSSSSNVDIHKSGNKIMQVGRHWDSFHTNVGNKKYPDGNHGGSYSSSKSFSSQNSSPYRWSRSTSQECSSRSSYYEPGNESKSSNSYQSQVEDFIHKNLSHSQHKSSKKRRGTIKKSNSSSRKKELELLEKLLQVKDPDLERELKKLAKGKLGRQKRSGRHKESNFSYYDYEERGGSFEHEKSVDRWSPMWRSPHRSPSPSSYSKNDTDRYGSSAKPLKSILKSKRAMSPLISKGINFNELEDEDVFPCNNDMVSSSKSRSNSQKEYSGSHKSQILSQLHDESDSDTNITDSNSSHGMWARIHQLLNEQKQNKDSLQSSSSSRKIRDSNIRDKSSQYQDQTIKNILKSIGFDVEMSNHIDGAKQTSSNPDYMKTSNSCSSQYGQHGIQNLSAEIDKSLLERTEMQILTIEKSLPCQDRFTGLPNVDTSVPPPPSNFPAALLPPPPLLTNRPHPNSALPHPPLAPPVISPGYGQIPPLPSPHAVIPPRVPFLPRQPPPFGAPNLYANVQPQQFNYGDYNPNLYYDNANSLASSSPQSEDVPSSQKAGLLLHSKSDAPIPCATTSAFLPGLSQRKDRSPHSLERHSSPKAGSWSPEREWSPRRERSSLSPRKNHTQSPCTRRSRNQSRSSLKRRLKRDRSPLQHSPSPLSQRSRSPPWLHREKTPPTYDRSPPAFHRHSWSPTRFDSPNRSCSLTQSMSLKLQDTKSHSDDKHDKSGSSSGDSDKDIDSLSPQEIEQMRKICMEHIDKVETLQKELNILRKQENELMRKKQRVKDGHKDPILVENTALQDEVNSQISLFERIIKELSKTLELSGIKLEMFPYNDKSYQYSKHLKESSADLLKSQNQSGDYFKKTKSKFSIDSSDKSPPSFKCELSCENLMSEETDPPFPLKRKKLNDDLMSLNEKSLSDKKIAPFPLQKSFLQESSSDERKISRDEEETKNPKDENSIQKVNFEYFDPGNHWCRHCNLVSGNIYELFQHLQSKKHKTNLDHYDRPWLPESIRNPSNKPKYGQVQMAPIKGVEFLMSTNAFYCTLCKEFSGDVLSGEAHLKSDGHNMTYQKYIKSNPYYEKRLNLDKAAGLQFFTSEKNEQRKNIDDSNNEKNHASPERIQCEIKEKTIEDKPNPDILEVVEIVPKEEPIEKCKDSDEESKNKDPEVVRPPNLVKEDSIKSVCDVVPLKEKTVGQQSLCIPKKKIPIKLTGKTGIKPVQYTVMPLWVPVGKMLGRRKRQGLKSGVSKKVTIKEFEKPPLLDDFLISSNNGNIEKKGFEDSKTVTEENTVDAPVLEYGPDIEHKDEKVQPSLGADKPPLSAASAPVQVPHLLNATLPKIPEQSKEENLILALPPPPIPSNAAHHPVNQQLNYSQLNQDLEDKYPDANEPLTKSPIIGPALPPHPLNSSVSSLASEYHSSNPYGWTEEDLNDMKLLGIDPAFQIPMAEIRPPPPLPPLLQRQNSEKNKRVKSIKDRDNRSSFNKTCSTTASSADDGKVKTSDNLSLEKTPQSSTLSFQSKKNPKKNKEISQFLAKNKELQVIIKTKPDHSSLKCEDKVISPKSPEKKLNLLIKADPTNESITETLSNSADIVKESESFPVRNKAISQPEVKVSGLKEKKAKPISIAKSVSTCASLSGIPDASSLKLQPTISLVPLPASLDMALSSDWEIPLQNRSDVLIRESEHNYALRLMENSDHIRPHRNNIQLHDVEKENNNNDAASNNWKTQTLKVKRNVLNKKCHEEDEKKENKLDSNCSSESDSADSESISHDQARCLGSDDSTSPPVLTHEQEQSNLISKHEVNSNNSSPPLSAESPCLTRNVSLSCPSNVVPVTLICSPECDNSSSVFTTCIDSTPILENSMSILNFDSVVRDGTTKSMTRGQPAKKKASGNKSSSRSNKKATTMKKKAQLEAKPDTPTQKPNHPELNSITGNKIGQEKIIVKVTSHTSEGVPVISLTAAAAAAAAAASANVANSSEPSVSSSTTSFTSTFTSASETETGDTSLVEAAAKKAETLPKMFMPTVVLHDIKYTMGRDLSQLTAIPASIDNIPIFESENESDNDIKMDSPKQSRDFTQCPLKIESPSKSSEAFDPYMFLNRPAQPSIPSTSSCTNESSSFLTCSNSHLVGESSSLTNIAVGGTSSSGQVTADSLPSLDHHLIVSSMFDVTDSKYAFPEVFLENGEPETTMKLSAIDVLGPELPFETSGRSSISLGLDHLTDFDTSIVKEETG